MISKILVAYNYSYNAGLALFLQPGCFCLAYTCTYMSKQSMPGTMHMQPFVRLRKPRIARAIHACKVSLRIYIATACYMPHSYSYIHVCIILIKLLYACMLHDQQDVMHLQQL